jgi:hypothetical protein
VIELGRKIRSISYYMYDTLRQRSCDEFLFFPSTALWLMTVAVFASQGPIHLSSHQEAVITATADPVGYWSLKFGLLLLTIAFSGAALLRYRALTRTNV